MPHTTIVHPVHESIAYVFSSFRIVAVDLQFSFQIFIGSDQNIQNFASRAIVDRFLLQLGQAFIKVT